MVVTTHQPIFLPWPGFFYFRYNVSALDLVLNCGPIARDIIAAGS